MHQRLAAIIGAIVSIGLFLLTKAKWLADAISIIHLPHDIEEFLTSMSQIPVLLTYSALLIGIGCVIYIAASHWLMRKAAPTHLEADKPPQKAEVAIPIDPRWSRDLPLSEALWRVYNGHWSGRIDLSQEHYKDAKVLKLWDAASSIRQRAFDGSMPIWARRRNSTLHEPVPKDFWLNHEIEVALAINSPTTDTWVFVTHPLVIGEVRFSRAKEWEGFMTSKEAVESLWPQKP